MPQRIAPDTCIFYSIVIETEPGHSHCVKAYELTRDGWVMLPSVEKEVEDTLEHKHAMMAILLREWHRSGQSIESALRHLRDHSQYGNLFAFFEERSRDLHRHFDQNASTWVAHFGSFMLWITQELAMIRLSTARCADVVPEERWNEARTLCIETLREKVGELGKSDLENVAGAAAIDRAGAACSFLTLDRSILGLAARIKEAVGIEVVHPREICGWA